ncbi:uncharacterized protein LOC144631143 [Oculina patagonica]
MAPKLLMLSAVITLFYSEHFCFEDTCRTLKFSEPLADSSLEHHVLQSTSVDNNDQCELKCYLENSCLSYNLGMLHSGEKLLCELSDSDHNQHPGDLVSKNGFSYHPTAKLCGGFSCPRASSCVPDQQGNLRCICPTHWPEIENCERESDECSSGTHDCSADAYCSNTLGSFTCTCNTGFVGDGKTCIRFLSYWTLNGSDQSVSLHSGASYEIVDGKRVLYLDVHQHSYAETPAIPIQTTSFSVLCWIKILSLPSMPVLNIYSDWSAPYQFRIAIIYGSLCLDLRRPGGNNEWAIVNVCGGYIITGEWMHVASTWSRENRVGKVYINGIQTGQQLVTDPAQSLDLNPTGHMVFDIGLKRDSGSTLDGYLRDLILIDKAISDQELKSIVDSSRI